MINDRPHSTNFYPTNPFHFDIDDCTTINKHLQEDPPPERIRKRKQEDEQEEGEVPDPISQYFISDVANHLVLLANSCPTTCYLLMRAVRIDRSAASHETHAHAQTQTQHNTAHSDFAFSFDDNFRNDDEAMMDESSEYTASGIEWNETPDLVRSVAALYKAYDEHDCTWESIDFTVFVDESGENWCFKCVFSYPASSTKKRCVVTNPPFQPDVD